MSEKEKLLDSLLASKAFARAGGKSDLLKYLAAHINEYCSAETLWVTALGNRPDSFRSGGEAALRTAILELKRTLEGSFPSSFRGPRFALPAAQQGKGYRLIYNSGDQSCPNVFWAAHLNDRADIAIIVNQPLFFRNEEKSLVFRCFGVNPIKKELPLMTLQRERPEMYSQSLDPATPYFLAGEINAFDAISRFFRNYAVTEVSRGISSRTGDDVLNEKSLILLGDSGLNRFIEIIELGFVGVQATPRMWVEREDFVGYRVMERSEALPYGGVRIYSAREQERTKFPGGDDQETSSSRNDRISIYSLKNNPVTRVYVVVTRTINPFNNATVTIISSLYSEAIEKVAMILTDEILSSRYSSGLPWQEGNLPDSFQGIFAIQLGDVGAFLPQQVCWRVYESPEV